MATYKHLLVAIDLTDESQQVLGHAREEAQLHGAQLSVVHVLKPFTHVYGGFGAIGPGDFGVRLASVEVELRREAEQRLAGIAKSMNVPAERTHMLTGSAAPEIRQLAAVCGADLIVIGTHGQHGLGLLLGSTANAVLHGAAIDVLVVRVKGD